MRWCGSVGSVTGCSDSPPRCVLGSVGPSTCRARVSHCSARAVCLQQWAPADGSHPPAASAVAAVAASVGRPCAHATAEAHVRRPPPRPPAHTRARTHMYTCTHARTHARQNAASSWHAARHAKAGRTPVAERFGSSLKCTREVQPRAMAPTPGRRGRLSALCWGEQTLG